MDSNAVIRDSDAVVKSTTKLLQHAKYSFIRVSSLSFCILSLGLLLVDCGGGGNGSGPCTNCTPTSSDFVYEAIANQVLIFEVDSNSGVVQSMPTPVMSAMIPGGIVTTSNNFLYVTESEGQGGSVYAYAVNTATGDLTPVAGSPFDTGVLQPAQGMAVDPTGKFLYIMEPNTNQVAAFTIAANGALTAVAGSPFDTKDTRPVAAAVDASGSYLYVSNQMSSDGSVSAFSINSTTGALTPIAGSPFATLANGEPARLSTDPEAKFLYVPMSSGASVVGFDIGSTGTLSPIAGSPFTVGGQPNSTIVSPSGKFLFTADFMGNDVSILSIDASTGALTPVAGSPVPVSNNPYEVAINPSGTLLFVGCTTAVSIDAFTISSTGTLTSVAPLNGGPSAGGLVIIHKIS